MSNLLTLYQQPRHNRLPLWGSVGWARLLLVNILFDTALHSFRVAASAPVAPIDEVGSESLGVGDYVGGEFEWRLASEHTPGDGPSFPRVKGTVSGFSVKCDMMYFC